MADMAMNDELRRYVGVPFEDVGVPAPLDSDVERSSGTDTAARTYDTAGAGDLMKKVMATEERLADVRNDLANGANLFGFDVGDSVREASCGKDAPDESGLGKSGSADGPEASVESEDETISF